MTRPRDLDSNTLRAVEAYVPIYAVEVLGYDKDAEITSDNATHIAQQIASDHELVQKALAHARENRAEMLQGMQDPRKRGGRGGHG